MNEFTNKQLQDIHTLITFTRVYCRAKHHEDRTAIDIPPQLVARFKAGVQLCPACQEFLAYALQKRSKCTLEPKPSCKHCHIHCYSKEYRAKVREIMAFSGRRLLLRGRIDYLWHYFF